MAVTVTNLLMGPANLFSGAVGLTEPPSNATPLTGATDVGGTLGGLTLTINQTYTDMTADQIVMAGGARRTALEITCATQLAEATLPNLRLATNQATSAATNLEIDADAVNSDPNYTALVLEGIKPGGGKRRVFLRRTLSVESIGVPFTLEDQTVFPVTWKLYYVSSSVKPIRVEDAP